MIVSMTAYGRGQVEQSGYRISVDLRAVNGRYLDIIVRLPKHYLELEDRTRKEISRHTRRGRVEVSGQIEPLSVPDRAPRINLSLARFYWRQLQELRLAIPTLDAPNLAHLLQLPNLFETKETGLDLDLLQDLFDQALGIALDGFNNMRRIEGEALTRDIRERIETLRSDLGQIHEAKAQMLPAYQQRLRNRIQELLAQPGDLQLDQNRLLQELALFAERSDINEEVVRIDSHLEQLTGLLDATEPAEGRQLDFLTQELLREVNTIGSKANDLNISRTVVRMKSEIGKLKEQVQNVE